MPDASGAEDRPGPALRRWPIEPMKAAPAAAPPPDDGHWAYEVKWDGVRALAYRDSGGWRLQSRSGRDITAQYPELSGMAVDLGRSVIIDGEIVALDEAGRPSFERLQSRINLSDPRDIARRGPDLTVLFMAFDLLQLGDDDTTGLPYRRRRELLADLGVDSQRVQVPRHHVGDGTSLLEATRAQGLEGLVAKRLDGAYLPGRRTRSWLKVKNFRRQEFVVGGWLGGQGWRRGRLGALLVGYREAQGNLTYAGRVGSGFDDAELHRLQSELVLIPRATCPFAPVEKVPTGVRKNAHWVEPRLVVEIAFREWTASGTLRAPSYKGQRLDTDPDTVIREP